VNRDTHNLVVAINLGELARHLLGTVGARVIDNDDLPSEATGMLAQV
jgi:hypothetical protein